VGRISKSVCEHEKTKYFPSFPFFCCGELNPDGCKSNLDTTYKHNERSKIRFTETVNLTLITFTCVRFPFATFGNILISLALVSISSFVIDMPLNVGCN